jgi:hypothetical protein
MDGWFIVEFIGSFLGSILKVFFDLLGSMGKFLKEAWSR